MGQNLPNELAARVKFTDVVKRLDKIEKSDLKSKPEILSKFFKSIFELQKKFHDEEGPEADASFYPFLRLFVPTQDTERGSFGIQTPTLGRLYVKALGISSTSETAQQLTNLHGNTTDYGDIVYNVMKNRSPEFGTSTVYEVNRYLDLIADHFQNNERSKIDTEIVHMFSGMSALDRKWLTRIILKKLKLGIGNKRILEQYNPRAFDLYNQCNHLSDVCNAIESNVLPDIVQQNGLIQVFRPVRSMLCERGYISQINRMLAEQTYYMETKMDGERCQVHFNGTEFKYYSRGVKGDLTAIFGANNRCGLYSPFFYNHINRTVKDAIFDGEMMVWDREEEVLLKKSENFTAKFLKQYDPKLVPCYVIYDLIFYNGASLVNKPYAERVRLLSTLINEQKGALMLCKREKLRDSHHFLECLNKAFDSNEEGIVIKQEDSKYHPGQREKGGWFKMKPDYENNLISDFDLLIIGGYYNDNKTAIDSFLLAVLKKGDTDDSHVCHAACKIRNGLKRSQFREIASRLQPYQHKVNVMKNQRTSVHECPAGIEWANANPDFWYEPKHSVVIQIKASDLVKTTTYRTSHSFRFPRVMEIRWDKAWYDTCSLTEFDTFCSNDSKVEFKKLTKRNATADDLVNMPLPKRPRKGIAPNAQSSTAKASTEIQPVDNICDGREFCIHNGEKKTDSLEDMENMVKRHGGLVVKSPGSKTFVIIVGNPKTERVKNFIRKKSWNIATPNWLIRALGSDKPLVELIKFTSNDMVFATESIQEQFNAVSVEPETSNAECDLYECVTPEMNFDQLTDGVNEARMNELSTVTNEHNEMETAPTNEMEVYQLLIQRKN